MSEHPPHRAHHHVQLPGGREIEVVYLDSQDGAAPTAAPKPANQPTDAPGEALHVCPSCAGGLVHPLDWSEETPGRWRVRLRCPDCGKVREDVFGQTLIERFDDELDRASAELLSDLRQITYANMSEEIQRFARALDLDLIGPADFQRP